MGGVAFGLVAQCVNRLVTLVANAATKIDLSNSAGAYECNGVHCIAVGTPLSTNLADAVVFFSSRRLIGCLKAILKSQTRSFLNRRKLF